MRNSDQLTELVCDKEKLFLLSVDEIPELLGQLEAFKAMPWARLMCPNSARQVTDRQADRRLNVEEAAEKLGTSKDWLYRHPRAYPSLSGPGAASASARQESSAGYATE
jgi:hypothetical protein